MSLQPTVSTTGSKRALFDRIQDCGNPLIHKVDDLTFSYKQPKVPEGNLPKWVVLAPQAIPPIAGMNMRTGVQEGHYGSTNKENAEGAEKMQYLVNECDEEKIKRPTMASKKSIKFLSARAWRSISQSICSHSQSTNCTAKGFLQHPNNLRVCE